MAASHEEESYRFPDGSSLTTTISPQTKDRKIETLNVHGSFVHYDGSINIYLLSYLLVSISKILELLSLIIPVMTCE